MPVTTLPPGQSVPAVPNSLEASVGFVRKFHGALSILGIASLLMISAPASAQLLGTAESFAILGGTAVTAAPPMSTIDGNVGIAPAAASFITGFPANATINSPFINHGNDGVSIAARAATTTLFNSAELAPAGGSAITPNLSIGGPSANGHYVPGKYTLASGTAIIPTTITLDGAGIYVFSLNSDITTSVGSTVILNGVDPCTVFWRVPTLATLNGTTFPGTVVAGTGVHLGTGSSLTGRALVAAAGDVTLAGSNNVGGCSAAAPVPPTVTVNKVSNGGVGTFSFTGNNGFANQSITTLTSGVGVAAAAQTLAAAGVSTTITESAPPAGFTLTSISCSGLGEGGATPNLGALSVTLDGTATAAGATVACTFTNTFSAAPAVTAIPTLSEWAMIALAGLLAIVGFVSMRRRVR